jgi:two-component system NtrC family sensor kinase
MKTEPPAAEPFQAFFDTLRSPAAVCDEGLRLVAANQAFTALVGTPQVQGMALGDLLQGAAAALPSDGETMEVPVEAKGGHALTLTVSRRGPTVAVLARDLGPQAVEALLAAQAYQERHDQMLLELGRQVASATSEEELVAVVARAVKQLFPARMFCIRIADSRTRGLTSLYAEGRLRDMDRDVLVLKKSALRKVHLEPQAVAAERVRLVEGEVPLLFEGTARSISAPLVASGQLFGVINVEYLPGRVADLVTDERLLHQLVNQVAVAIRNAKLIDELTFVRKYLEELLEHANALIVVVDPGGRVVVFNRQMSRLTGHRREDVLGREFLSFVAEGERLRLMRVMAAALKGEAVSNFETRLTGLGGKEARVSFATSSVMTADGTVEGVIAIGQDLTVVRDLEKRVIHAEKLATLGQLAASVVHEINNPMTAVATYAHALLARQLGNPAADPADQEKLRKILESSERILKFTRDLVSYARPAQDKPEVVDLHQLLDTAVSFCDHVISKHGVTVERAFGAPPQVAAVKGNLVQVFVNLITNACHAMGEGGRVVLHTEVTSGEVIVQVKDSGAGIAPADLPRVFEPFFTTKPDGKGTGLGLSIVQGIVENHGGDISVESEPGRGTVFTIRLPPAR